LSPVLSELVGAIQVDGAQIAYRRTGNGRPLVVLNGFAATSADWDPSFIDVLASSNELILVDNRGIGSSTDNGRPFGIDQLADDAARVIEMLDVERPSVLGWSISSLKDSPCSTRIVLTNSSCYQRIREELTQISPQPTCGHNSSICPGRPMSRRVRLLSLVFPSDVAESIYSEFGDIVAAARAQLSPDLVNRQVAAMDAWHRTGVGNRLREINVPVLIATGTADIVIPPSNALRLVSAIPGAWLAQFNGGGHAFMYQYPRPLADLINSFLELG
jgi:pimeloyl-ACP methyl ester carboxylesterase